MRTAFSDCSEELRMVAALEPLTVAASLVESSGSSCMGFSSGSTQAQK